jgi:hypothetical protein
MSLLRSIADQVISLYIGDDLPGCTHVIVYRPEGDGEFWELRSVRRFLQEDYPVLDGPEDVSADDLRSHVERAIGRPVTLVQGSHPGGYCVFPI